MEKKTPLMACGHAANGTDGKGNPVCVICAGIRKGAYEVVEQPPDLTGREATCLYCKGKVPSDYSLPFFEYRPDKECDAYYCGCRGWD